jgi:hypothetical protein
LTPFAVLLKIGRGDGRERGEKNMRIIRNLTAQREDRSDSQRIVKSAGEGRAHSGAVGQYVQMVKTENGAPRTFL